MYQFNEGTRVENISNWGLEQFHHRYSDQEKLGRRITKDAIFRFRPKNPATNQGVVGSNPAGRATQ